MAKAKSRKLIIMDTGVLDTVCLPDLTRIQQLYFKHCFKRVYLTETSKISKKKKVDQVVSLL